MASQQNAQSPETIICDGMKLDCLMFHTVDDSIKAQWRTLESQAAGVTASQTWDWNASWCLTAAEVFKEKPYIVVLAHEGKWIAILPMAVTSFMRLHVLTWLAQNQNAYNLPIIDKDWVEKLGKTEFAAIFDQIAKTHPQLDMIYLTGHNEKMGDHPHPLKELGCAFHSHESWLVEFPDGQNFDQVFAKQIKTKRRKELRRKSKLLDKNGCDFQVTKDPEEQIQLLKVLMHIREETPELNVWWDDFVEREAVFNFYKHMISTAEDIQFIHARLKTDDNILSIYNGPLYKGTFLTLTTAMRRGELESYSPGSVALMNFMRYLRDEEGAGLIDFGPGNSLQKQRWNPIKTKRFNTYIPLNMKGKAAIAGIHLKFELKSFVKKYHKILNKNSG